MALKYSVACENDDLREDLSLRDAKKVAKTLHGQGRQHVVINGQTLEGDLVRFWKFVGHVLVEA